MKLDPRLLVSLFLGVEAAAGCASGPASGAGAAAPPPSAEVASRAAVYADLPTTPTFGLAKESPRPAAPPEAAPQAADAGVPDPGARRRHRHADPAPDPDRIRPDYCPPCGMG